MPLLNLDLRHDIPTSILPGFDVGFWSFGETAQDLSLLLDDGENYLKKIQSAYVSPKRQREKLAVKVLLEKHFSCFEEVAYLSNGCPQLVNDDRFVSISHSSSLLAVAISHQRIGIDLEERTERAYHLRQKFLLPSEEWMLAACEDPVLEALKIWTAKEAAFKMKSVDGLLLHTNLELQAVDNHSPISLYKVVFPDSSHSMVRTFVFSDFVFSVCIDYA